MSPHPTTMSTEELLNEFGGALRWVGAMSAVAGKDGGSTFEAHADAARAELLRRLDEDELVVPGDARLVERTGPDTWRVVVAGQRDEGGEDHGCGGDEDVVGFGPTPRAALAAARAVRDG